jgi:hypothetical protein
MGGEILGKSFMFPVKGVKSEHPEGIKHEHVHDLEGFFWVLCYLCMTREGPNSRRPELRAPAKDDKSRTIQDATYDSFGQPDFRSIRSRKRSSIRKMTLPNLFSTIFTPLFELLKYLVRYLYNRLWQVDLVLFANGHSWSLVHQVNQRLIPNSIHVQATAASVTALIQPHQSKYSRLFHA